MHIQRHKHNLNIHVLLQPFSKHVWLLQIIRNIIYMPRLSIKCVIMFPYSFLTCLCPVHIHMLICDKAFQNISVWNMYISVKLFTIFWISKSLLIPLMYESKEMNLYFILKIQIISQRQFLPRIRTPSQQPSFKLFQECDLKDLHSYSELVLAGTGPDV